MNRIQQIGIALSLLLLGSTSAVGQRSLGLGESRRMALEYNKSLQIAHLEVEQARHTQRAMRTHFLPKLSASGYALYSPSSTKGSLSLGSLGLGNMLGSLPLPAELQPMLATLGGVSLPPIDYKLSLNRSYMGSVTLTQPIYTGGKITAGYRMSRIGAEMRQLAYKTNQTEVLIAVEEAYWLAVQAREMHQVAKDYQQTIIELERIVRKAVEAGMRTRNELLRVQVEQSKAELQLQQASNAIRLADMNLCQLVGLELGTALELTEPLDRTPKPLDRAGGVEARNEYALLDKQVQLRKEQVRLTRADYLPTIGLQGAYTYVDGVRLNGRKLVEGGSVTALASVSIPIWNWGEGRSKVRAAKVAETVARLELQDKAEKMSLELQQSIDRYNEGVLEVDMHRKTVVQAQENREIGRNRHQVGMDTTVDLLEAETLYSKAKADLVLAQGKLMRSYSVYRRAAGLPLEVD